MKLNILKSKIHRVTVTQADLDYVGSITIDKKLMDAANILEYEKVDIVDVNNGNRFQTYVIAGDPGSKIICLNGAAARCVQPSDKIIIMCYCEMDEEEYKKHKPKVVFANEDNSIDKITNYEKHGEIR